MDPVMGTIGSAIIDAVSSAWAANEANKEASHNMKKQYAYNMLALENAPSHQVAGLRKAGLNPMLAVGKGISGAPTVDAPKTFDAKVNPGTGVQAMLVASQIELNRSLSAKALAEAKTEEERPGLVRADTELKGFDSGLKQAEAAFKWELMHTQQWSTRVELTNHFMKKLEYEVASSFLPEAKKLELQKMLNEVKISKADASRAETDTKFYESEIGSVLRTVNRVVELLGLRSPSWKR